MASSSSSFSLASTPVCNTSASDTNPISSSSPIDESPAIASNQCEVPPSSNDNNSSLSCSLGNVKRKPTRPPAPAWEHFTRVGLRAKCNYCGKDYAANPRINGTSNLNTHISLQCKKFPGRELKQKSLSFQPKRSGEDGSNSKLIATSYNPEYLRESIARYIIKEELPFRHVESEGFRDFCRDFEPRFSVPSRTTTTRDVLHMYKMERERLKNILVSDHQRVCLTTDTWTSIQNMNYMCLTVHYIDSDWRYQKRIINFCQVLDHRGETLGKSVEACLLEWGIENVLTVTVDNASANDTAISFLAKIVNNWKGSIMSSQFIHMRCAHILNLVVTDGLKDYHESINKIRDVVRYWRGSPARLLKFKACVDKQKITSKALLCHDVPTRWNSTYLMLDTAEKFQKAFERLEEEDGQFVREFYKSGTKLTPSVDDWNNARALTKFLKVFYDATLSFSGSICTTSNEFLWQLVVIHEQLKTWTSSKDEFLRSMGNNMKKKYDKYWGSYEKMNPFLFVAILIDPRHKEDGLEFCFGELCGENMCRELTDKVKNFLHDLYDEYKLFYPKSGSKDHPYEAALVNEVDDGNVDVSRTMISSRYLKKKKRKVIREYKTEVDQYLMESCEADKPGFDIFEYWKKNSDKYIILSYIAKDILAIPVSTVASESAFSTGGRVLDPYRSSLSPTTVQALICTQNWLRSKVKNDICSLVDDIEDIEADVLGGASEKTFDEN